MWGKGGGGGGDGGKEDLVTQVKAWQRKGEGHKQSWYTFCQRQGTSNYDPNRHEPEMLSMFMRQAEAGEISVDENAQPAPFKGGGSGKGTWGGGWNDWSGGKGGGGAAAASPPRAGCWGGVGATTFDRRAVRLFVETFIVINVLGISSCWWYHTWIYDLIQPTDGSCDDDDSHHEGSLRCRFHDSFSWVSFAILVQCVIDGAWFVYVLRSRLALRRRLGLASDMWTVALDCVLVGGCWLCLAVQELRQVELANSAVDERTAASTAAVARAWLQQPEGEEEGDDPEDPPARPGETTKDVEDSLGEKTKEGSSGEEEEGSSGEKEEDFSGEEEWDFSGEKEEDFSGEEEEGSSGETEDFAGEEALSELLIESEG